MNSAVHTLDVCMRVWDVFLANRTVEQERNLVPGCFYQSAGLVPEFLIRFLVPGISV